MSVKSPNVLRLFAELTQLLAERQHAITEFIRQLNEADSLLIRVELLARVDELDGRVRQLLRECAKARGVIGE